MTTKREEIRRQRDEALLTYERELWEQGVTFIGGIDEVGRGPLAGPVMAACVILPRDTIIEGVYDSKKLSAKRREALCPIIREKAAAWGIGRVEADEIDRIGIAPAVRKAMVQAVNACKIAPEYLLVDAMKLPDLHLPVRSLIKGDMLSASIAAASILAKVARDAIMADYAKDYPLYGFDRNAGYGTAEHVEALRKFGPCPLHRLSFHLKNG